MTTNEELYERGLRVIPGGVNSPVRAFRSVGGVPYFVARARGAHVWDVEGRRFVDLVQSYGASILGHADPRVVAAVQDAVQACLASTRDAAGLSADADVGAALGALPARLADRCASGRQEREPLPEVNLLKLNELQRAAAATVILAELDTRDGKDVAPARLLLHGKAGKGVRAQCGACIIDDDNSSPSSNIWQC